MPMRLIAQVRTRLVETAERIVRRSPRLRRRFGLPRVLEPSATRWFRANQNDLGKLGVRLTPLPDEQVRETPLPECLNGEPPASWLWARQWKPHERYYLEIPNGQLAFEPWRCATAVIAPGPSILHDAVPLFFHTQAAHPVRHSVFFSEPLHLRGRALLLFNDASSNYYHWFCDILPRLLVAQKAGKTLADFDHFITDDLPSPFHRDSLKALGIPEEKIIIGTRHRLISADTLCVPSLFDRSGMVRKESLTFVRDAIMRDMTKNPRTNGGRRIFISRQRSATRRILNWDEVAPVLDAFGFEQVFNEELSIHQQAALFDSADHIIAAHGAGLTNLMFCRPGTRVLEILNEAWGYPMYWLLSAKFGLDYTMMHASFSGRQRAEIDDLEVDAVPIRQHLERVYPKDR